MAIPVTGKVGFVCPASHVQYARHFLPDCENFLVIGFSALDSDVVSELKAVKHVRRMLIVDGSGPRGQVIRERLVNANSAFDSVGTTESVFEGGFNDFATSGRVYGFLEVN
jgi:hypothetical protein